MRSGGLYGGRFDCALESPAPAYHAADPASGPAMRLASRSAPTALRALLLLVCLAVGAAACAGNAPTPAAADDGPYVFRTEGSTLDAVWICDGKLVRTTRPARDGATIKPRCGYPHPLVIPAAIEPGEAPLAPGARIVALSDIHGQYGLLVRLLRAHHVIDSRDRWALGRDHLVVAGDVFDRGPGVTEALWLLFQLQQQARAAGGAVHFLLGNHETMALYGSLRYVNPKYVATAERLGRSYADLFGPDSVLGGWLRTRPVLLKLGDTLFLHGGVSPENLDLVAAMDATNAGYQRTLGMPREQVKADPAIARLYDSKASPVWYRGYFNGQLDTPGVRALVAKLGVARVVVGHTTIGEVASFHDGKIIAIDSGIKRGKSGQLLFIDGDTLSRGLLDGRREPLPALLDVPDDPE
jgi:hypothetical protein